MLYAYQVIMSFHISMEMVNADLIIGSKKEVKELISSLNPQLYYIYEDLTLKEPHKYLFSHAGITKDWLDYNNLELKDLDSIDITNLSPLDQIPYSRSGYNKYAMLDCCKPFVLDTENNELKEWKLNSQEL